MSLSRGLRLTAVVLLLTVSTAAGQCENTDKFARNSALTAGNMAFELSWTAPACTSETLVGYILQIRTEVFVDGQQQNFFYEKRICNTTNARNCGSYSLTSAAGAFFTPLDAPYTPFVSFVKGQKNQFEIYAIWGTDEERSEIKGTFSRNGAFEFYPIGVPGSLDRLVFCPYLSLDGYSMCETPSALTVEVSSLKRPVDAGYGSSTQTSTLGGPLEYQVELSRDFAFNSSQVEETQMIEATSDGNIDLPPIYDLPRAQLLWGRARSKNEAGWSGWSTASSIRVAGVPAAPDRFGINSGADESGFFAVVRLSVSTDTGDGTHFLPFESYVMQVSGTLQNFTEFEEVSSQWPAGAVQVQQVFDSNGDTPGELSLGDVLITRLRACNFAGCSGWSEIKAKKLVRTPGAPSLVHVISSGLLQVTITFSSPTDAGAGEGVHYNISEFHYSLIHTLSSSSSILDDTSSFVAILGGAAAPDAPLVLANLTKGEYTIAVRAKNDAEPRSVGSPAGVGSWSLQVNAVALEAPSSPRALSGFPKGNRSVYAQWLLPDDCGSGLAGGASEVYCTQYQVETTNLNTSATSQTFVQIAASAANTGGNFSMSDLPLGHLVSIRVRAISIAGNGEYSASVRAFVFNLPTICTIENVTYAGDDNNTAQTVSLLVQWTTPEDSGLGDRSVAIKVYTIEAFTSSPAPCTSLAINVSPPVSLFGTAPTAERLVYGLQRGCRYELFVSASNIAGRGPVSGAKGLIINSNDTLVIASIPTEPSLLTTIVHTSLPRWEINSYWSLPKDTGRGDTTLELVNYQTKLLLIRDGSLPQIQQQRLVPGTSKNVSFVDDRLRVGDVVFVTIAAVNMYGQGASGASQRHELALPPLKDLHLNITSSSPHTRTAHVLTGERLLTLNISFVTSTRLPANGSLVLVVPMFSFSDASALVRLQTLSPVGHTPPPNQPI